jgi:hypothetical protein
MEATVIVVQIHADKNLYRFVGPHGPSHATSSRHDLMKLIKFVYGDVEIKQEIADFDPTFSLKGSQV